MAPGEEATSGKNDSFLTCYDRTAVEIIVKQITECVTRVLEQSIDWTDEEKATILSRFLEVYKNTLHKNIQVEEIKDETTESSHVSSTGGSVVTEKREKYFNMKLLPELDTLIRRVASCRKSIPLKCVKLMADQCRHEHNIEAKRQVKVEPCFLGETSNGGPELPVSCADSICQSCSSVAALSRLIPDIGEKVSNLEQVFDMQSSIGNTKTERVLFNPHPEEQCMAESLTPLRKRLAGGSGPQLQKAARLEASQRVSNIDVKVHNFQKGFIKKDRGQQ